MMIQAILAAVVALGAPRDVAPEFASAVAKYARTPEEASLMLSWAEHESHFARRIADGDCRKWECDHGRARGLFQEHRGAAGAEWSYMLGDIDAQVRAAARTTRWVLKTCKGDARCSFRVLGGLRTDVALKGEDSRVRSFTRVRGML
jgi:hypothetical protein